jgi:hypothetical protein
MRDPAGTLGLLREWDQAINTPLVCPVFYRHKIFLWVSIRGCCNRSLCPKLLLLPTVRAHHSNKTGPSFTPFRWKLSEKWWYVVPLVTIMVFGLGSAIITVCVKMFRKALLNDIPPGIRYCEN